MYSAKRNRPADKWVGRDTPHLAVPRSRGENRRPPAVRPRPRAARPARAPVLSPGAPEARPGGPRGRVALPGRAAPVRRRPRGAGRRLGAVGPWGRSGARFFTGPVRIGADSLRAQG
ncbi:hypothetical protein FQU76_09815 [Streptomyces qinzhouensis]|uniref:Uncharacterized protein n=1 Tax=Streptomyces qinzhouensis TaxID=2599401 RepID=A0A5B8J8N1_9ACTN|nr:hypothetical protein FQU76_09815 [Streptomyces qinzhouensis]